MPSITRETNRSEPIYGKGETPPPWGLEREMSRLGLGIFLVCLLLSSVGCATDIARSEPDTGLTGEARHTGTVTVLRVDDSWRGPDVQWFEEPKRAAYRIGDGYELRGPRFVPLRHKADVSGWTAPTALSPRKTSSQSASTPGSSNTSWNRSRQARSLSSFPLTRAVEPWRTCSYHSAKGHTPGSFFALDDWPVLGPMKVAGDHLRIRVVLIELDRPESAQARNLIKFLSQTAGTVAPGLAGLFSVAQPIVDQLLGLNADDVVLDYRFSLRRTSKGVAATESPLLYGKYVLMLQQDRLASPDSAPLSVTPIVVSEMRFDRYANRVQKTYNFQKYSADQIVDGPIGISELILKDPQLRASDLSRAVIHGAGEDVDFVDHNIDPPDPPYNTDEAKLARIRELGYVDPVLSDYELWESESSALLAALLEGCRGAGLRQPQVDKVSAWETQTDEQIDVAQLLEGCHRFGAGRYGFDYPVSLFPSGYTVLAQYPLHTHLVFSVERSVGGRRRPIIESSRLSQTT